MESKMNIQVETAFFKRMIKAICLNGGIETPKISFKKEYLEAVNIDIANASLSACHFDKNAFLEYEVAEEEEIGIEAEKVMKVIGKLSGDEITMSKDKNSLVIVTEHEKLKIPTIETTEQKFSKLVKVGENGEMSIEIDVPFFVNETIPVLKKELESMGEMVTVFEMKNGKLSVMQEATDGYSFQSDIREELKCEDFTIMFNTDYLKNVFDSVIDDEVLVKLGSGSTPMILEDKTKNYQLLFILVPRVEYNG